MRSDSVSQVETESMIFMYKSPSSELAMARAKRLVRVCRKVPPPRLQYTVPLSCGTSSNVVAIYPHSACLLAFLGSEDGDGLYLLSGCRSEQLKYAAVAILRLGYEKVSDKVPTQSIPLPARMSSRSTKTAFNSDPGAPGIPEIEWNVNGDYEMDGCRISFPLHL